MTEYIDKAKAIMLLNDLRLAISPGDWEHGADRAVKAFRCAGIGLAIEELAEFPAADVVEVVRCRECENWDTDWVPSHAGEGQYFCPILGQVTDTDFYCGCGKRKDGGQDDV